MAYSRKRSEGDLDRDKIQFLIEELWKADRAVFDQRRQLARQIIDLAVKDLQNVAWQLNTLP